MKQYPKIKLETFEPVTIQVLSQQGYAILPEFFYKVKDSYLYALFKEL